MFVEDIARPVLQAPTIERARGALDQAPMPSPLVSTLMFLFERHELTAVQTAFSDAEAQAMGELSRRARRLGSGPALQFEHAMQTFAVTRSVILGTLLALREAHVPTPDVFGRPSFVALSTIAMRTDTCTTVCLMGLYGEVRLRSREVLKWLCEESYTLTAHHFAAAQVWIRECQGLLPEPSEPLEEPVGALQVDEQLDAATQAAIERGRRARARLVEGA
ncbi:MAG: hypothetical protein HY909_06535 [Deltaproteobacteria bacterium]|nr:hypothetical protein [Deltaproteobacteria bacterium]